MHRSNIRHELETSEYPTATARGSTEFQSQVSLASVHGYSLVSILGNRINYDFHFFSVDCFVFVDQCFLLLPTLPL